MLLDGIEIRTELIPSVFESDSNSAKVLVSWVPVYSGLNALTARKCT